MENKQKTLEENILNSLVCGIVDAWRDNYALNFYMNIYCCCNEYMDKLQSAVLSLVIA
jgi:hypothetical protein